MHKHKIEKLFCCVCKKEIPDERILKQAVTCSKFCSNVVRNIRRRQRDLKKCRYCNMPSSPEERKLFKAWRDAQGTKPKRGRRPKAKPAPDDSSPQAAFTEMIQVS